MARVGVQKMKSFGVRYVNTGNVVDLGAFAASAEPYFVLLTGQRRAQDNGVYVGGWASCGGFFPPCNEGRSVTGSLVFRAQK